MAQSHGAKRDVKKKAQKTVIGQLRVGEWVFPAAM
jgi:hypothetical protein